MLRVLVLLGKLRVGVELIVVLSLRISWTVLHPRGRKNLKKKRSTDQDEARSLKMVGVTSPIFLAICIFAAVLWQNFNFNWVASQLTTQTQDFQQNLFTQSKDEIKAIFAPSLESTKQILLQKIREHTKATVVPAEPTSPAPPILANELDPLSKHHEAKTR